MTALIVSGTVLLLMAACIGAGGFILTVLGILGELSVLERISWSFSVGLAAIGWLMFFPAFAGVLSTPTVLLTLVIPALFAAVLLVREWQAGPLPETATSLPPMTSRGTLTLSCLLVSMVVVLGVDALEGLSPPAEADSLAYHFNLPRRHLETGGLLFIPRALDGSPPQLVHMTYMAALALGGEQAMTLWTMVSGWMTGALLFVLARRWLPTPWAIALALIYLSTPAVLQTGGTGHIEPRIAQFALLGAIACGIAVSGGGLRYAALAGLCAGAFAASKYTGIVFGAACFLVLLFAARRFRMIAVFGTLGGLVAFQWYMWNWLQSGDPVFPLLYRFVGTADPSYWNDVQDEIFRRWQTSAEIALPASLWTFLAYPFYATFIYQPELDNGRTGLGIFAFIMLPFAMAYLLKSHNRASRSPLFLAAGVLFLFAVLWFFGGLPQRVRHLLPLYPLALLLLAVPAVRWASSADGYSRPLMAGATLAILIQLGGQLIFGLNYGRHVFTGESREAFLRRNVSLYDLVPWINMHLDGAARVLTFDRQLLYLFDTRPVLSAPDFQARFNFRTHADRPDMLFDEMRRGGITHILEEGTVSPTRQPVPTRKALQRMLAEKCVTEVHRDNVQRYRSRTLAWSTGEGSSMFLYALTPETCRLTGVGQ